MVILGGVFLVWTGVRTERIRFPALQNPENRKLFLIIALGGNLLGMALTWQRGTPRILKQGEFLERREDGSYGETFQAKLEEEQVRIDIQVPEKEGQEEIPEEPPEQEEVSLKKRLEEEIAVLNEERADPDKYFLPETLDGKRIIWEKPGSTDGALLAALCLVGALALSWAREREKEQELEKRREQMVMDYPGIVMKLTLLVQAGMTVRSAFRKIAGDYEKRKKEGQVRYAYEEMITACHEMDSGISETGAYERFAARCNQVKYKTLATLMVQNLQRGSRRLLEMLEREAVEAFEDRKRHARVLGEAAATKLLVPMVLMLMVVLAIVMIPAGLSFYG